MIYQSPAARQHFSVIFRYDAYATNVSTENDFRLLRYRLPPLLRPPSFVCEYSFTACTPSYHQRPPNIVRTHCT